MANANKKYGSSKNQKTTEKRKTAGKISKRRQDEKKEAEVDNKRCR